MSPPYAQRPSTRAGDRAAAAGTVTRALLADTRINTSLAGAVQSGRARTAAFVTMRAG